MHALGNLFITQQIDSNKSKVSKVIFEDFRKIDFIFVTKTQIIDCEPFWISQKIIFSNSKEIERKLKNNTNIFGEVNPQDINKLSNEFWFISYTKITKLMRNDLLIAPHLALELYKNCLLLGMWLRDRDTSTTIHKIGNTRNDLFRKMDIKLESLSKEGLLSMIEECGVEFDKFREKAYIGIHKNS